MMQRSAIRASALHRSAVSANVNWTIQSSAAVAISTSTSSLSSIRHFSSLKFTSQKSTLQSLKSSNSSSLSRCFYTSCKCIQCSSMIQLSPFRSISTSSVSLSKYPDHILLTMPALSPTMEKGNLASWKKAVGDSIKVGEVMAEVETDKATVAFEAVEEGYLAKILVGDNSNDVTVGVPVAVLAENKEDVDKFKDFTAEGESSGSGNSEKKAPVGDTGEKANDSTVKKSKSSNSDSQHQSAQQQESEATETQSSASSSSASSTSSGGRIVASPNARRVAGEKGIDLSRVKGTGPEGRIVTADVLEQQSSAGKAKAKSTSVPTSSKPISASADGDFIDIPHSNMRKVIAQRLTLSKQTIPHYYLTIESNVDQLLKVRAALNARAAKKDGDSAVKLSVNDFLIKAASLACKVVPQVNSSWQEGFVRQYSYVDVSVAVSTDAGLVTPIVKDADIKGLTSIAKDIKQLAAKARANKLSPAEYQGGTFTISNLGMFGISSFQAIINPPQAAILAVGTTEARVVQVKGKEGSTQDSFSTSQILSVSLSCDHRVVDGAVGAQWLQAFKGYIENPITMLL